MTYLIRLDRSLGIILETLFTAHWTAINLYFEAQYRRNYQLNIKLILAIPCQKLDGQSNWQPWNPLNMKPWSYT
jgi:hypothetical protein